MQDMKVGIFNIRTTHPNAGSEQSEQLDDQQMNFVPAPAAPETRPQPPSPHPSASTRTRNKKSRRKNRNLSESNLMDNEQTALVPSTTPTEHISPPRQPAENHSLSFGNKHRVTIKDFPGALVKGFSGRRLDRRAMTVSKFVRVDSKQLEENNNLYGEENDGGWISTLNSLRSLLPESAALYLLRNHLHLGVVDPNTYLQGASEIIATTLVVCWITTLIFNPKVIFDNPLRDRLGYSDLCVGWDTMPANVLGSVGTSMGAYLAIRFVDTNEQRMSLLVSMNKLSEKVQRIGRVTSVFFAFSVTCMPIIFVIPPTTSVWGHSLPFMMYIVSSALVVLGRFIMFQDELTQRRVIYLIIYCLLSVLFPTILICEYTYYAKHGEKSPWPGFVTMVIDYSWFILLSILPYMLPRDIVLVSTVELGIRKNETFRGIQEEV